MTYNQFYFIDIISKTECEHPIYSMHTEEKWDRAKEYYTEFSQSEYYRQEKPLYDKIVDFLTEQYNADTTDDKGYENQDYRQFDGR